MVELSFSLFLSLPYSFSQPTYFVLTKSTYKRPLIMTLSLATEFINEGLKNTSLLTLNSTLFVQVINNVYRKI